MVSLPSSMLSWFDVRAHAAVRQVLGAGDLAVDATAGNGHDTVFLAGIVGTSGLVLACDVQKIALDRSRELLQQQGCLSQVRLFAESHDHLPERVMALRATGFAGPLMAVMFNLGFLPGSDRTVRTQPDTTLSACAGLLPLLAPGGLMSVHAYTGHAGGLEETLGILRWAESLPWPQWRVTALRQHNKPKNREYLLLVHRTR